MPAGNSSADFAPAPARWLAEPSASFHAMSFTIESPQPAASAPAALDVSVSVLIRSVDRPSLPHAVQSVLAQTHARTRVRIVAARGEPLRHWPPAGMAADDRVEVLVAERPLARSAAANRLLDGLGSECALFLDDDDCLLPDHV